MAEKNSKGVATASVSYGITTGDLVSLVETPKEHVGSAMANYGGVEGVASRLKVDLSAGLSSKNEADLIAREITFGKNYVEPERAKGILELMWDAFQVRK